MKETIKNLEETIKKLQDNLKEINSKSVLPEFRNPKKEPTSLNWILADFELPHIEGRYIVESKTLMGNTRRLETYFNGKQFSCNNQKVIKWLKEE